MPRFAAIDWGTTNRRVFVIDADGSVLARAADDAGILSVSDFPAEIAALRGRLGDLPLLMAGMVGSNRGWHEVSYVSAPAGIAALVAGTATVAPGVFIVPGVVQTDAGRPDVMRGEEVQMIGAAALGSIGDGLACHPGTHTKWIEMEGGAIARFRTVMTGDLFAALKGRSILSDLLAEDADDDTAFIEGVDHALEAHDLTAELFGARARVLTGMLTPRQAASRVSGLLIGSDVRAGLGRGRADLVPLIGDAALCARFALALQRAGRETRLVDGEAAFVAGARAIFAELAPAA